MFHYKVYGLNISSDRPIGVLEENPESTPDLRVFWETSGPKTPDNNLFWKEIKNEFLENLPEVSIWENFKTREKLTKIVFILEEKRKLSFLIDKTRNILKVFHTKNESLDDLDSYFVGPVLSFILRLRGKVCLHASSVSVNGKAIALLGHSTTGKSTTAAGLAEFTGAQILADDVTALYPKKNEFIVQPGYRKVRLRPNAANFLVREPEKLPLVYSYRESRYFSLPQKKQPLPDAAPLSAIYVLGNIDDNYKEPLIKPIKSIEKVLSLIEHTSGSYVVRGDLRAKEFAVLTKIAKTIPMRRIFYSHKMETLPRQCDLILEDFNNLLS